MTPAWATVLALEITQNDIGATGERARSGRPASTPLWYVITMFINMLHNKTRTA
jgi:hypothetical protein